MVYESRIFWWLSSEPISAHHSIFNLLSLVVKVRIGALRISQCLASLREDILLVEDVLRAVPILTDKVRVDGSFLLSEPRF